jgi:hypothetical protein
MGASSTVRMRRWMQLSQIFTNREYPVLDSDAMLKKPVHGLLLAAVLGLAACSTENLPIVGRPAASYDNGSVKMADYKLRLKVLQENYRKQKQAQGEVKFPSLDGPAGRNNEVILE